MKVEATGPDGASVNYSASASGGAAVDCSPGPGTFPLGTTTVNCNATGSNGKQASASFNVSVVDTTPPTLKVPDAITRPGPGAVSYDPAPSASDLVDPSPSVSCTPASGSTFQLGSTTVNCTASDKSSNTSKASFSVTVADSIPPQVKNVAISPAPNDKGWNRSDVTVTATATDGSGGSGVKSMREGSGTPVAGASIAVSVSAEGQKTLSFTATDVSGNTSAPVNQIVKIDKTAPVLHVPGGIEAGGATGAVVKYPVSATDNLDPSPSVLCDRVSGSRFPLGVTTVTCTATDAAGNSAKQSFTVTVDKLVLDPPPPGPRPTLCDRLSLGGDLQIATIPFCP
jgi:hypothetical protein